MTKAICGCRHSIKCVCIHCLSTASYGSALACPPLPPRPTPRHCGFREAGGRKDRKARIKRSWKQSGRLLHCRVNVIGKVKMTDVETNWKRSRKAEEEEGPVLLEEKAVGGGGQAREMQGPPS